MIEITAGGRGGGAAELRNRKKKHVFTQRIGNIHCPTVVWSPEILEALPGTKGSSKAVHWICGSPFIF